MRLHWTFVALGALGASAAGQTNPLFPSPQCFAGEVPVASAAGDLDGDALLDLVVAGGSSGGLSVLRGNGQGGFGPASTMQVGSNVRAVALGDLNGDGKLDLVFADMNAPAVAVALGDGAGGFGAFASTVPNVAAPFSLAIGDATQDGNVDVVVGSFSQVNVAVLLGDGAGGLSFPTTVAMVSNSASVALGDLDGDGFADLIAGGTGLVGVRFSLGFAAFDVVAAYPVGTGATSIAVGDLDGNGSADVAAASQGAEQAIPLLNDGAGTLVAGAAVAVHPRPLAIALADLTGDGALDVVTTSDTPNTVGVVPFDAVAVLIGSGGGGFGAPSFFGAAGDPTSVSLGDFDADGHVDAVVTAPTFAPGRLSLLLGDGRGNLGNPTVASPAVGDIALVDLDGDGLQDLLATNGSAATLTSRLGLGGPGFGPPSSFATLPGFAEIAIGDVNADATPDALVVVQSTTAGLLLLGNGAGGFGASAPLPLGSTSNLFHASFGDLNGDGKLDLVVARYNGLFADLGAHLGDGLGGFTSSGTTTTSGFGGLALADVTGDGKLDALAVGATLLNPLPMLASHAGNGAGGLAAPATFGLATTPSSIAVADLDGDGALDAAVGLRPQPFGFGAGGVSVSMGLPGGGFAPAVTVQPGPPVDAVRIGDVSSDGKRDLVAARAAAHGVEVLLNDGLASFPIDAPFSAGVAPSALALADLDGNGTLDVAVANRMSSNVSIALNRTPTGAIPGLTPFGTGTPGCAGPHVLTANSAPNIGNLQFTHVCTNVPPSSLGLGIVSDVADFAGSDPFGIGITLHVDLFHATYLNAYDFFSGPKGPAYASAPIPNNPAFVGLTFYVQAIFAWGSSCALPPFGLSASPGLVKTIRG